MLKISEILITYIVCAVEIKSTEKVDCTSNL